MTKKAEVHPPQHPEPAQDAVEMQEQPDPSESPAADAETKRLSALKKYAILDTAPETEFDRLTDLAARLFDVPIAFISFVDENRSWLKSSVGLADAESFQESQFCRHTVLHADLTVVTDAAEDPRFRYDPAVTGPLHLRFYAGAPLRTSGGHNLGAFAVCDTHPRTLDDKDQATLRDLAAIVVDTLERRRTESELKLSEERLQLSLDAGRMGAWDWWIANGTASRSPRFMELYGFEPSDSHSEDEYHARIHPDDREFFKQAADNAIRNDEDFRLEYRVIWPDSSLHWLEMCGHIIRDQAGKAGRITGTLEDITHRKQTEQLIQEARNEAEQARSVAEEASRAKTDFLSRMSHELRTPLNAILGFAQLLEMEDLPPNQSQGIAHILKGGRHLLDLINEVLEITRIESGRLEYSIEPVAVTELIDGALSLIRPQAKQAGLQIGPPLLEFQGSVLADRQRLHQVLVNFLSNAVKYNRREGEIRVSCGMEGDRVRIRVSDTGVGISEPDLEKLFVPFERLGAGMSGIEGTGIGLALSRRLTEGMGGTIGVVSRPEQGSTFWVELPAASAPEPQIDAPSFKEDLFRPEDRYALLYIEDNLSNIRLVEHILNRYPQIDLIVAMQGRRGLELALEHQPYLIFLDLHLPDVRGDLLLLELKADVRTRDIPVVMVTADATASQRERLLTAGADYFLTKPLNVREFLNILETNMSQPRPTVAASGRGHG